jgi:hypothetical protein
MKNITYLLIMMLFFGCKEEFDLRLPDMAPKLVVEGIVTNGPGPHYVRLTLSQSAFLDYTYDSIYGGGYHFNPILDAKLIISDNLGTSDTLIPCKDTFYVHHSWTYDSITFHNDSSLVFYPTAHLYGYFQTNSIIGIPGNTYYLKVLWNGVEYNSSCFMPPLPKIDSVTYDFTRGAPGKSDFYIPKIWFKDNPSTKDYYLFKTTGGNAWGRSVLSDDNINSNITGLNVFQGETHSWWLNSYPWPGQVYSIEMSSITKEIYDYYRALIMQFRNDGGIYTPSPASPPTNITNGALGYFRASSIQFVQDTMPDINQKK